MTKNWNEENLKTVLIRALSEMTAAVKWTSEEQARFNAMTDEAKKLTQAELHEMQLSILQTRVLEWVATSQRSDV